uniref:BRCT domain-containing protein n=1 Tax=Kalanchoe fedtschenkoi TaxID=63787 RepID=A0A7N0TS82_KALFE
MRNLFCSGAYSFSATSLSGYGFGHDGNDKFQTQGNAKIVGDVAVRGIDCVRNAGTESGSHCEEVVPDSDDEDIGKQEEVGVAPGMLIGGNVSMAVARTDSDLVAEEEDHRIVADSEEECDEGILEKVANSAPWHKVGALDFSSNGDFGIESVKPHPSVDGRVLILNEREGNFSNWDGDSKKSSECLNGAQPPRESSQADALKFIDHFLMCNNLNLPLEGRSKIYVKQISPRNSCSKGVKISAQKISNSTAAARFGSNDLIDRESTIQVGHFNRRDVLVYSRRRKRCAIDMPVTTTVKSSKGHVCRISSNQQENQELLKLSKTTGEAQLSKVSISGSEKVQCLAEGPRMVTVNINNDTDVETLSKQQDLGIDEEGGNETFDDVFSTQMAAEVIETLSFEPPMKCNAHIVSQSFQNIIPEYSKDFLKMEAQLGYPSLLSGSCPDLRRNGDRLKHKNITNYKASLESLAFQENDAKKGRYVDPYSSIRKEDKPGNEQKVSEKLFFKTAIERKGKHAGSECFKEVLDESSKLSFLDSKECISLSKGGFDTKLSTSLSAMRWMTTSQLAPQQKTKDGTKDCVHAYKRRSAIVRKENRSPNLHFGVTEDESNSKSKEEGTCQSNTRPFNCIDLNTSSLPKGKRMSRGSSNLGHSDSIIDVRQEADIWREFKCPLAKRHKLTNHSAEPAWIKFSRKKRTSVAFNKQAEDIDLCNAEVSKRFTLECNESRSCTGDRGKNTNDSNKLHGSDCLTSASSNSGIVPPVSNSNSDKKSCTKKMPKFSLVRELIQLGFSDLPLGTSCRNLRRRKHVANIQVLLSQHLDSDTIRQQKRVLAQLGISIAFSASGATHFVANTFLRTKNMLEAIALGRPIVTKLWLESSAQVGCLVDEKNYILRDDKKEREIGFSLSASLAKAARYPLLKDCTVFITPNIRPEKSMLSSLVKIVGGTVVEITKNCHVPEAEDIIVLSCEDDYVLCMPFLDKGIPIYQPELLLNGIVIQKLELQRHHLFSGRVKGLVGCKRSKEATR